MAETGHIKNVENLGKARDFATGWGATYVPSNPNLAIAAMTALFNTAQGVIDGVQTQKTPYRHATADCEDAFEPLSKLTTRVMKALGASGASGSVIEDAESESAMPARPRSRSPAILSELFVLGASLPACTASEILLRSARAR